MYGYPREPEATDVEPPANYVPYQRVSSEPVAVPGSAPVAELPPAVAPIEPEPTATAFASVPGSVTGSGFASIPRQPGGESTPRINGAARVATEAAPLSIPAPDLPVEAPLAS